MHALAPPGSCDANVVPCDQDQKTTTAGVIAEQIERDMVGIIETESLDGSR
jgi:hypothetical protein